MTKGIIVVAAVVGVGLACGLANVRASSRLVGVVNAVGQNSFRLMTSEDGVQAIRTDEQTGYMRWILHKPWQEGSIDSRALSVGRCVSVDLRSVAGGVAKFVWISTDDRRTVWDPCKSIK